MLICRPVSARSEPRKIRRWMEELESKRQQYQTDASACEVIDCCIEQAAEWLSQRHPA